MKQIWDLKEGETCHSDHPLQWVVLHTLLVMVDLILLVTAILQLQDLLYKLFPLVPHRTTITMYQEVVVLLAWVTCLIAQMDFSWTRPCFTAMETVVARFLVHHHHVPQLQRITWFRLVVLPDQQPPNVYNTRSNLWQVRIDADGQIVIDLEIEDGNLIFNSSWENDHGEATHLTDEQIQSIPNSVYVGRTDVTDMCAICQVLLEGSSQSSAGTVTVVKKLVCGHIFHSDCVSNWLRRSNTCPVCRTRINVSSSDAEQEDEEEEEEEEYSEDVPEPPLSP